MSADLHGNCPLIYNSLDRRGVHCGAAQGGCELDVGCASAHTGGRPHLSFCPLGGTVRRATLPLFLPR